MKGKHSKMNRSMYEQTILLRRYRELCELLIGRADFNRVDETTIYYLLSTDDLDDLDKAIEIAATK